MLLIHTAAAEGVVALADNLRVITAEVLPGRGSSEHLMPAIRQIFERVDWRVKSLDVVAVVTGPGSFTGMRVGLSAAKGLCEAGSLPLVALSRLALLAGSAGRDDVAAFLDAGRGEYYCGVYDRGHQVLEEWMPAGGVQRAIMQDRTSPRSVITCERRVQESLSESFGESVRLLPEPGPKEMLTMATRRMAAGEWSDVALTEANYLRRTDAEASLKSAAGDVTQGLKRS